MKRILVTGGPVHAHLDSVKIITNRFKGGRMLELAYDLALGHHLEVSYLGAKHVIATLVEPPPLEPPHFITHNGFADYQERVLDLAPKMDAVILGAAVANLIPKTPWKDKFPSHDYKPGDEVSIPFVIAPRVIDQVRAVMKPHALLYGFKLLDDATALLPAAQSVLEGSRANAVFANMTNNLDTKWVVTPEGGNFECRATQLPGWISDRLNDVHFTTERVAEKAELSNPIDTIPLGLFEALVERYSHAFTAAPGGHLHGALAVRLRDGGFIVSARGKTRHNESAIVDRVDWATHRVLVRGPKKASLAAPLFQRIWDQVPDARAVVHIHEMLNVPSLPYAPPGTAADAMRFMKGSFAVEGHGSFLVLNFEGRQL